MVLSQWPWARHSDVNQSECRPDFTQSFLCSFLSHLGLTYTPKSIKVFKNQVVMVPYMWELGAFEVGSLRSDLASSRWSCEATPVTALLMTPLTQGKAWLFMCCQLQGHAALATKFASRTCWAFL